MSLIRSTIGKKFNGIVSLYKPPDVSITTFKTSFFLKLCCHLNKLPYDDNEVDDLNYIEFSENDPECVDIKPSYETKELVSGPRFGIENVNIFMTTLGKRTSGICGINNKIHEVVKFLKNKPLIVFHVKGKLGEARRNFYKDGKIVHKANYSRIKKETIDDLTSFMESEYQRNSFKDLGIDLRSQEAYELAISGNLNMQKLNTPCLYSIKCIDFNPPEFTLEIASLSVSEAYLIKLIHKMGLKLRIFAHCTGIRCVRYGQFAAEHSLVKGEWTLENIYDNMALCKSLMVKKQISQYEKSLSKSTL